MRYETLDEKGNVWRLTDLKKAGLKITQGCRGQLPEGYTCTKHTKVGGETVHIGDLHDGRICEAAWYVKELK